MYRSPEEVRHVPNRVVYLALVGIVSIGIFVFLDLLSIRSFSGNSDGATVILEGQSIAHGNIFLHGWILSQDSFWSIDAVFYSAAVFLLGVHGYFLHAVPAFIATLVVLVGARLATTNNNDGSHLVGLVFVLVALGVPGPSWAQFYLAGPYHVGTVLWSLLAFWLCSVRPNRWKYLLACVLLAAGILGDLQMLSLAVIPLAVAGGVAMVRTWSWRLGLCRVVVAGGSVLLAIAVRKLGEAIGTFTLAPARSAATFGQALQNVMPGVRYLSDLVGVGNGPFGPSPVPNGFEFARVVELACIAIALLAALAMLLGNLLTERSCDSNLAWQLDDLLLIGAIGSISTYAYLATFRTAPEARYLSAGLIFGAILTARMLARWWRHPLPIAARSSLGVLFAASAVAIVVSACYLATSRTPQQPASALISFLRAHHLRDGLGGYWTASITTVESNDMVKVRPVITGPQGTIVRYARQSAAAWYQGAHPNFLAYNADVAIDSITRKSANKTFGRPLHAWSIGAFKVLEYRHLPEPTGPGYSA